MHVWSTPNLYIKFRANYSIWQWSIFNITIYLWSAILCIVCCHLLYKKACKILIINNKFSRIIISATIIRAWRWRWNKQLWILYWYIIVIFTIIIQWSIKLICYNRDYRWNRSVCCWVSTVKGYKDIYIVLCDLTIRVSALNIKPLVISISIIELKIILSATADLAVNVWIHSLLLKRSGIVDHWTTLLRRTKWATWWIL